MTCLAGVQTQREVHSGAGAEGVHRAGFLEDGVGPECDHRDHGHQFGGRKRGEKENM